MDYDLDLENDTFHNTTDINYEPYIETALELCSVIGVICDILIIYAVIKNHRMKSRRNILLLYWAIFDAIGFELFVGIIVDIWHDFFKSDNHLLDVCLLELTSGVMKLNCVILMLLMVSTTVARLEFIKGQLFLWGLCLGTVSVYIINFYVCYAIAPPISAIKFVFMFFILLVVLLVKEVNICCKAHRDDPISEETRIKINLVRIYTYNHALLIFLAYFGEIAPQYFLHLIPLQMFIYLCIVDLNFRNAFRLRCCKKTDADIDATVVYNVNENKETVEFTRI